MADQPHEHCADKLLLVTEMLQAAAEYLTACRSLLDDDDPVMARLAYEQVLTLKNRVINLTKKVDALEADLRRKIIESTGDPTTTKRRSAGPGAH